MTRETLIVEKEWEGTEHQTPCPKIEIFFPSNTTNDNPNFVFRPEQIAEPWSNLLSYQFSESTDSLDGSFSFTTENGDIQGRDGKTVSIFDYIPIRSVVKIYEGGKQPAFTGIIRRQRIGKQMASSGIKRVITFSGKSIASLVGEYVISLDTRLFNVADPVSNNNKLTDDLIGAKTVKDFINISYEHFKSVSLFINEKLNGKTNTIVAETIEKFMGDTTLDFVKVTGEEQNIRYNIASIFYNAANNNIVDGWRNVLPQYAYEIFSRCKNGKPKIIVRQVPYGDPKNNCADWTGLDLYVISPISLTAYDLDRNDDNVFTVFSASIIGSPMAREFYRALKQEGVDDKVRYHADKVAIYGFKPLNIDFMGYNRQGNTGDRDVNKLTEEVKKLNELAAYWYSRNDDMYQGTITLCTDFKNPEYNPRVGCRAKFLGGEFYINKVDHTWTFGGTPYIKLTVSRGIKYDSNGEMISGDNGILNNVGGKYRELEREAAVPQAAELPTFRR